MSPEHVSCQVSLHVSYAEEICKNLRIKNASFVYDFDLKDGKDVV